MELTARLTEDRFGNSLFDVVLKHTSGEVVKRTLSLEDYINLLANSVKIQKEKMSMIEVAQIPKGCLKLRRGENPADFDAVFFLPEEMVGAKVFGAPVRFLQPKRVVYFSHRAAENGGYGRTSLKVFAVKDDIITDSTKLYWYPLGHVQCDGGVCTGGACSGIKISGVEDSYKYFEAFFTAESSGHYFSKGKTINQEMTYGEMMEALSGLKKFPYEWLNPSSCSTLSNVWKTFGN